MMEAEDLLDLLGSKTRRKILFLLAERPRFVSELAENLGIGRKAVIEHLEMLEKAGIVRAVDRRIEKGRPRKYYEICNDIFVKIVLTRDSLVISRVNEGEEIREVEEIENKLDELELANFSERRIVASYIVEKIEKRLREIEEEWAAFHRILERAKRLLRF